jgi:hypothetical protein
VEVKVQVERRAEALEHRAGDLAEFALVLPVPEVLGPEDVGVGDAGLIQWLEAYGTPRAVAYTCEDLFDLQETGPGCGYALGCASADMSLAPAEAVFADDSVTVESSFSAAGYDMVVLSAEESADLFRWLRDNGYEVPRGGDAILQEYIDAGVYFLAAKVSLDAPPSGNTWLPPIRISYDADSLGLPIRIGTISADGAQEVLLHVLTDPNTEGDRNHEPPIPEAYHPGHPGVYRSLSPARARSGVVRAAVFAPWAGLRLPVPRRSRPPVVAARQGYGGPVAWSAPLDRTRSPRILPLTGPTTTVRRPPRARSRAP